ncbi:MAG: GAF domain-containing protein, partial [Chloroflexi bacterium]
LLAPPHFPESEDKSRSAAILNVTGWILVATLGIFLLIRILSFRAPISSPVTLILLSILLTTLLTLYISHLGYVQPASFMLITIGWIGLTYMAWSAEGIQDAAFFAYFVPILMASLLLGWKGAVGFTIVSVLSGWLLVYAEASGWFIPESDSAQHYAVYATGVFVIADVLIFVMITNLQNALNRSRLTTHELSISNKELSHLRDDLEKRVEERTSELGRRASQLEAVSSVARTIASVQDIDTLLPTITRLISNQFGCYHVGIFLLDEQGENAVLHAANSEGGQRMLEAQHSLPLDYHSIVGYSALTGEARVVLDVGTDSVYFNNPNLPETRSEMALPLSLAGRVIGSLDIQSTETNAFSQEDIGVLATLADQVAIAIENARLFSEARNALDQSEAMFEKYTQQEWSNFARQVRQSGFVFDGKQVVPLDNNVRREQSRAAIQTGSLSLEKASATIAVPIKLRGKTIGVLDVRAKKGQRQWKPDEIAMLEAAAERAALALENARLVESAQRRAAR